LGTKINISKLAIALPLFLSIGNAQLTKISVLTGAGETPLEAIIGTSKVDRGSILGNSFGVSHYKMYVALPGPRSSVRVKSSDVLGFLLRTDSVVPESQNNLPSELRLLVVKKGNREFVTSSTAMYVVPIMKHGDPSPQVLVNSSRYDEHAIKLVPKVPLLAGEYAFNVWQEAPSTENPNQRYAPSSWQKATTMPRYKLYCVGVE